MAARSERRPQRRCCACMQRRDKAELLRLVRGADGMAAWDERSCMAGRGAYLCRDMKCLNMAYKKKALSRALKCEAGDELYKRLGEVIEAG